jgi:Domain of unknown function (DUF4411)
VRSPEATLNPKVAGSSPARPTAKALLIGLLVAGSGCDRDAADPWVVVEAEIRGFSVVTYEGRTYSGVPTRNWYRKMPGICQHYGVACLTLPDALTQLGGQF